MKPLPIAHPRSRSEIWVHVDHFNKPKTERVWAIQYWCRRRRKWIYRTAVQVLLRVPSYTEFHGARSKQPRAVITVVSGRIVSAGERVWIHAR